MGPPCHQRRVCPPGALRSGQCPARVCPLPLLPEGERGGSYGGLQMTRDQSRAAGDDVREPHGPPSATPSNAAARAHESRPASACQGVRGRKREFPPQHGGPRWAQAARMAGSCPGRRWPGPLHHGSSGRVREATAGRGAPLTRPWAVLLAHGPPEPSDHGHSHIAAGFVLITKR